MGQYYPISLEYSHDPKYNRFRAECQGERPVRVFAESSTFITIVSINYWGASFDGGSFPNFVIVGMYGANFSTAW